jgi:hypothetical protein
MTAGLRAVVDMIREQKRSVAAAKGAKTLAPSTVNTTRTKPHAASAVRVRRLAKN